ncbi:MAG: transrane protein [Betaproteobacteria bacterium]|nr:transrane protein [Betaproteobacteria bacterium]
MHALDLDFRRPRWNMRWAGLIVLGAGLVGVAGAGVEYQRLMIEISSVEPALRRADSHKPAVVNRSATELQNYELETKYANDVVTQLDLPWDELFASVESADGESVALLSIESDAENGRIKISAEAKNTKGMLDYARALEMRSKLADIYMVSHAFQQQDPQHPVRFMLSSNWPVRK